MSDQDPKLWMECYQLAADIHRTGHQHTGTREESATSLYNASRAPGSDTQLFMGSIQIAMRTRMSKETVKDILTRASALYRLAARGGVPEPVVAPPRVTPPKPPRERIAEKPEFPRWKKASKKKASRSAKKT